MIIDHNHAFFRRKWGLVKDIESSEVYVRSQEITEKIIPQIKTNRSWVTVNVPGACVDHAIVFIFGDTEQYTWLKKFKDLVLICEDPETCKKVKSLGKAVYVAAESTIEFVEELQKALDDIDKPKKKKEKEDGESGQ